MKLVLSAEPEVDKGETGDTLIAACSFSTASFDLLIEMMGSVYDEKEPKQDTNGDGDPLFVDADAHVYTQAEIDALDPKPVVTPKYRPRTPAEVWFKVASGLTKGTIANVENRQRELAARAVPAPQSITPIIL